MLALLRGPGGYEERADIGEPSADGVVFARILDGGTFFPFKDTGQADGDGTPIFEYAM